MEPAVSVGLNIASECKIEAAFCKVGLAGAPVIGGRPQCKLSADDELASNGKAGGTAGKRPSLKGWALCDRREQRSAR